MSSSKGEPPGGTTAPDLSLLGGLGTALSELAGVVDRILGFDPTALTDEGVEVALQALVTQTRRISAGRNGLVLEGVNRCLPRLRSCSSPGTWLRDLVRVTSGEGNAWWHDAVALAPNTPVSGGDPLPPDLPDTAAALAEGAISDQHVRLVRDTMRKIPAAVSTEVKTLAEALLARQARQLDPHALQQVATRVLESADPDGSLGSSAEERARKRAFRFGRQGRDGMTPVKGLLDPYTTALARAAFDPLAAPQPTKAEDGSVLEKDGRTPEQRYHDAFTELARQVLTFGDLPVRHGHPATIVVTIPLADLQAATGQTPDGTGADDDPRTSDDGSMGGVSGVSGTTPATSARDASRTIGATGTASAGSRISAARAAAAAAAAGGKAVTTSHGIRVTIREMLRLAGESAFIPAVLDSDGMVLHFGKEQRLATLAQRRALFAMHGGCVWQGCTIPAAWCQIGHGVPFAISKRTSIDDLAPACPFHHAIIDAHEYRMKNINGRVWLIPPKWVDPEQRPRINEYFRPLQTDPLDGGRDAW